MKNSYTSKWILQRVTALFLIPLTLWFIYQCISFQDFNFEEMKIFFQFYPNSFLFLSMMIVMLIHGKLGCDNIIKDYISSLYLQKTFINLINLITIIITLFVIAAIFKLSIIQ